MRTYYNTQYCHFWDVFLFYSMSDLYRWTKRGSVSLTNLSTWRAAWPWCWPWRWPTAPYRTLPDRPSPAWCGRRTTAAVSAGGESWVRTETRSAARIQTPPSSAPPPPGELWASSCRWVESVPPVCGSKNSERHVHEPAAQHKHEATVLPPAGRDVHAGSQWLGYLSKIRLCRTN